MVKTIGAWRIECDNDGVMIEHRSGECCSVAVAEMVGFVESACGGRRRIPTNVVNAALAMEEELS